LEKSVGMANCPNCGKELAKPERRIANSVFCIEVYTCDKCELSFKRFG